MSVKVNARNFNDSFRIRRISWKRLMAFARIQAGNRAWCIITIIAGDTRIRFEFESGTLKKAEFVGVA